MLIYRQLDKLQRNEIISKVSLSFISQTLGLFTSSSPGEAQLNLKISSSCSEQPLNSVLHFDEPELLRKIIYSYESQNKPETENNRMPCLDELIQGNPQGIAPVPPLRDVLPITNLFVIKKVRGVSLNSHIQLICGGRGTRTPKGLLPAVFKTAALPIRTSPPFYFCGGEGGIRTHGSGITTTLT